MSLKSLLVMHAMFAYGDEAQRRRWPPELARGEIVGCFALTEPEAGSDPGAMATRAERTARGYRLTGRMSWITNAPIADFLVVWARSEPHGGAVRDFLLGRVGLSTPAIEGKLALRASPTGEIRLDDVEVGADALLPKISGLKGSFGGPNPQATARGSSRRSSPT